MTSVAPRPARFLVRASNFLLWFLVCVFVTFASLRIAFAVEDRWGHDAFIRWSGLAGFTICIFWFFVGQSEKFLRMRRFWAVTTILLIVHVAAFAIVLTHVEEWMLMWFMVMLIEYPLLLLLREKFVNPH
jgi:hypothetical protein